MDAGGLIREEFPLLILAHFSVDYDTLFRRRRLVARLARSRPPFSTSGAGRRGKKKKKKKETNSFSPPQRETFRFPPSLVRFPSPFVCVCARARGEMQPPISSLARLLTARARARAESLAHIIIAVGVNGIPP